MMRFITMFLPGYPKVIVYMLQSTEYQAMPYVRWFWRTRNFRRVMYRRTLQTTQAARMLLSAITLGMLLQLLVGLLLTWVGYRSSSVVWSIAGLLLVVTYPVVWAHVVIVPLILGRMLIVEPRNKKLIAESEKIFASHPGTIIAIAGSYGKTSMKELLGVVLAQGKTVAVTPANKNVSVSHAAFARKLTGNEDVVVIEYGEGEPGDVERFAAITHPKIAVITGLAPAHLDHYPSLQAAGQDIFSVADVVGADNTFVNGESQAARDFIKPGYHTYDSEHVLEWGISQISVAIDGTSFVMSKGDDRLELHSQLVGRHHVGPLAFAAVLAYKLGLTPEQIKVGVSQTAPFDHRMQPYKLGGAWVIDDTYNGNIDGLKAGLELLASLPARRKIYVTPGLVDQGSESQRVHHELGLAIAQAGPDKVVLMKNSVTDFIIAGIKEGGYNGELLIEDHPLEFYTGLEHFVAGGDVVLLQNDWPDNYN